MSEVHAPQPSPGGSESERLLEILTTLVAELHPHRRGRVQITPASHLERDLGLDSLSRMELLSRLERAFGVALPEQAVAEADTASDLLAALHAAGRSGPAPDSRVRPAPRLARTDPGDVATPTSAATLVEAVRWHARRHPDRVHVHLLYEAGEAGDLTYGALEQDAGRVAGALIERGLEPGGAVAIMLPTELDYFAVFLGVQMAGGVPVPIYPPARLSQLEDHFVRHAGILANAGVRWLVTFDRARTLSRLLTSRVEGLQGVLRVDDLLAGEPLAEPMPVAADDTAFLQYTSGSTGNPKGVVLTHRQVLASLNAMSLALEAGPDDVFVSWLPLYHDMGLIGAWLGSLVVGFPLVLMSPLTFLARPVKWLRAIDDYRGTLSGGPNFAYELCTRRIDAADLEGLDLSSWRVAFNGAEPVSPATLDAFAERFAPLGLHPAAIAPVYGLAEATLGVAFTPNRRGSRVDRVSREAIERDQEARPARPGDGDPLVFVSSGVPIPRFEVRIVDGAGREAPERHVGRVQFTGPGATSGYFRNPRASADLFDGDWVQTGDLGYVADGELFITGRVKDMIIRAGRNLYPYELEDAAGAVEGVRRGCVAVFGAGDEASGTERLVVVAETRETEPARLDALRGALEAETARLLGQPADEIVLAPPHTVLKTSSGKIRRTAMRDLHATGALAAPGRRALWVQVLRLALAGAAVQVRHGLRRLAVLGYAARAWLSIAAVGSVTWFAVVFARTPERGMHSLHLAGRAIARLAGWPLSVTGLEHLPAHGAYVLVSNHASYLDGLVLAAALDVPARFVVKGELAANPIARRFLEGLGALFVERFDHGKGASDAREMAGRLDHGVPVAVFPEGTLHRMPGLLGFQLGGFVAAVEAGVPVVPVTLRGTRSAMRGGTWLPRRAALRVDVGAPVAPPVLGAGERTWDAAVSLRGEVRAGMLARCGEPDLADRDALAELKRQHRGGD